MKVNWTNTENDRRCDLIDKKIDHGLTMTETLEFKYLQAKMMYWRHLKSPLPIIPTYPCPDCGKQITKSDGCKKCGVVWGRRGWRDLGMYDG